MHTSIFKQPVQVLVLAKDMVGDGQTDLRVHGGCDLATGEVLYGR